MSIWTVRFFHSTVTFLIEIYLEKSYCRSHFRRRNVGRRIRNKPFDVANHVQKGIVGKGVNCRSPFCVDSVRIRVRLRQ